MTAALADAEALPFRAPPGVRMVRIDARTGELPGPATDTVILEAFRPGTEPGVAFQDDDQFDIFGTGGDIFTPRRSVSDEGVPGMPGGDPATLDPNAQPGSPDELGLGNRGNPQPSPPADSEDNPVADSLGDTW